MVKASTLFVKLQCFTDHVQKLAVTILDYPVFFSYHSVNQIIIAQTILSFMSSERSKALPYKGLDRKHKMGSSTPCGRQTMFRIKPDGVKYVREAKIPAVNADRAYLQKHKANVIRRPYRRGQIVVQD